MPKRFILALEIPPLIQQTLFELDPEMKGVEWSPSAVLHLMRQPISGIAAEDEPRLRETIAAVQVPPFFLPVQGLGVFGGAQPGTIWAGVGKGHPHLFALRKRLQDALVNAGFPADLRPFEPHITLARVEGVSKAALAPFLRKHGEAELGLWKVTSFALFSAEPWEENVTASCELRREL
jgi:2'-5' RNA ligase